ncbi:hypothetical protein GJ744_002385 [Endocarpon pusillum]|uniref:Uncharacterized protein n=1 Tax=Endocarpon pusillum TaxID=364733 RepID=A0A8H7AN98_9EURO|nr:hypothetical protein GJ744_002385 [Endocarpon pusillum]
MPGGKNGGQSENPSHNEAAAKVVMLRNDRPSYTFDDDISAPWCSSLVNSYRM